MDEIQRIYREQHPDNIVQDLTRYGRFVVMALFAAIILLGINSETLASEKREANG
jgi:hypothetical protein